MPTQTDVQKLIQGLAPGAVNNGNPNTVYNTPGTVMGGAPAATQPAPLTAVSNLPQVTPASQLGAWVAPRPSPELNLPQWSMMPFGGTGGGTGGGQPQTPGTPVPAPSTGTPQPSPATGNPIGIGGFSQTGVWEPNPLTKNIFKEDSVFNHTFSVTDPRFQEIWGVNSIAPEIRTQITGQDGQIDETKAESFFTSILPRDSDGSVDWLEALDRITEIVPLLGGVNWHDSDSGKINLAGGIMQTVANALGLGPLMRIFSRFLSNAKKDRVRRSSGAAACVTVDSYIHGFGRAGDVRVFDTLKVIDPVTFELSDAVVSYSETKKQPTVRIVTKGGTVLECSKSAPICDETGEEVLAENLLGVSIPVSKHGMIEFEVVMEVEDIGEQYVQHITCENNYFLAGQKKGNYLLHHNAKQAPDLGDRLQPNPFRFPTSVNGFEWGTANEGVHYGRVGPVEQVD